jgi:hypothetical protein
MRASCIPNSYNGNFTDCLRGPASSRAGPSGSDARRALYLDDSRNTGSMTIATRRIATGAEPSNPAAKCLKDERAKEPGQPCREAKEGAKRQRRAGAQSGPGEAERGGYCERRDGGEQDDLRQRR